ncbi:MAG: hypothetical protein ACRDHW_24085 [Ktedonobacteraceae bacterium]
MNKLMIYTRFPGTVAALLKTHQLVDGLMPHLPEAESPKDLEMAYPDDAISQALAFWFAMAEGCGLISGYKLLTPWMLKEEAARKRALQDIRLRLYLDGKEIHGHPTDTAG